MLGRGGGAAVRLTGGRGRTNRPGIGRHFLGLLLVVASAEADGGKPPQQAHLSLLRMLDFRLLAALGPQLGLGRTRQLVDPRHARRPIGGALRRRRNEGARCRRQSAGGAAICSGNNDGFGGIGRMVTSSIIGRTAAATAALAAFSIASCVCCCGAAGGPSGSRAGRASRCARRGRRRPAAAARRAADRRAASA